MLHGQTDLLISGLMCPLPQFHSQRPLVVSMDPGVFLGYDLLISAALGSSRVRVAGIYTSRHDISFPFDPGSDGAPVLAGSS